jgi:hypothetical protein
MRQRNAGEAHLGTGDGIADMRGGIARSDSKKGLQHNASSAVISTALLALCWNYDRGTAMMLAEGDGNLGRVAQGFVHPKRTLETNNGLGVNLTDAAFRQIQNLANFPEREFFVVIERHDHALSFRQGFNRFR